jgi:hypothetical protein
VIYSRLPDRETLERLKRWPKLKKRFQRVKIYSAEWGAYWRGAGQGYTQNPIESETLDINVAFKMTRGCRSEKKIQFIGVKEQSCKS